MNIKIILTVRFEYLNIKQNKCNIISYVQVYAMT